LSFQDGAILKSQPGSARDADQHHAGAQCSRPLGDRSTVRLGEVTQKKSGKGAQYRYLTPRAEVNAGEATAVLNAGDGSTDIYIESGTVRFSEIGRKGVQRIARDAKGGEFIVREGRTAAVLGRARRGVYKEHAAAFSDDLPVLLDRSERRSEPKRTMNSPPFASRAILCTPFLPISENLTVPDSMYMSVEPSPAFRTAVASPALTSARGVR